MNILMFSWRGPTHPLAGGAEKVTHEHAKFWVKNGHNVSLFTSAYKGGKKKETVDGVQIIRSGRQLLDVHFRAFRYYRSLEKKPDILIDHFHGIPFFTPLYSKSKIIAFIHETAKEVWFLNHLPFPINYVVGLTGFLLEPFIFRFFYKNTKFITVSKSTKDDLVKWSIPSKNIKIVHNGFDKPIVKTVKKSSTKTAIYLGALTKDKGIEDALKAFARINKEEKNWQFWVVGRGGGSYEKYLVKLAKKLGLEGNIKFWGYVTRFKKYELLAKAHVLINPSILEGWGLVNIEANSVKTPVIAYDVVGVRDSVRSGKTGLLVPKRDHVALARKTIDLISNKDLFKDFQENAYKWSKKFSWEKSVKNSLEYLEKEKN